MMGVKRSVFRTEVGFALSFACVLISPLIAAAQVGTAPGSIVGQITDETGAVLPGVTVTATSPALQIRALVATTDASGEYRLTPLPIGTYAVEYMLQGFQTLRQANVRLTPGFVARLDPVLKIGSLGETIIVSGASPIVDVATTAMRTEVTQISAQLLPLARSGLASYLNLVPGTRETLDVGGRRFADAVQFRVYGQSGDSWSIIEGVVTTSPLGGGGGQQVDFDSIEAVRAQSTGHAAEMPGRGIMVESTVKSGGNAFHGAVSFDGTTEQFQANNIDIALREKGVTGVPRIHPSNDVSAGIGGKIIEDKLWFYTSARYRDRNEDVLGAFQPDGTPARHDSKQNFALSKLSYQATPKNKFVGFYHDSRSTELRGASSLVATESQELNRAVITIGKIEWQAVYGQSLTVSVLQGRWTSAGSMARAVGAIPKIPTLDQATQQVGGDALSDGNRRDEGRTQTRALVSWFRPNLLWGHHEFKGGFDTHWTLHSPIRKNHRAGNYRLVFDNGAPFAIDTFTYPVRPEHRAVWTAIYGQDNWTIKRRLTLALGLRFARENAYIPEQCREQGQFAAAQCYAKLQLPIWHSLVPRLNGEYDLLGDGTTVVKGGYGRFVSQRTLDRDVGSLNPLVNTTTRYRWRDLNGNRAYDAGEVNLALDGPDIISSAAGVVGLVNPDLKPMSEDQFTLVVERQLMPDFGVRIGGVYAVGRNTTRALTPLRPYSVYNIPITSRDPGLDGVAGNGDDPGTSLTYFDYPVSYRGSAFDGIMIVNDPNADRTYKTIEVAAVRRLSGRWQASASYAATRKNIPFPVRSAFNPNAEINTAEDSWEITGRAAGSYEFWHGIMASANFDYRNGADQARQVLIRGGQQIASLVVNAEPIGRLHLPSVSLLDLRIQKTFSFARGRRISLRATIANVLNSNPITLWNVRAGPDYLKPTTATGSSGESAVLSPRVAQFGWQLDW